MVQEMKQSRYRGVLCSFCRQPIPLPSIVSRLGVPGTVCGDAVLNDIERSFHIRCRACEKESSYWSNDVIDIEGTPRLRSFRPRPDAGLFSNQRGLARAANG